MKNTPQDASQKMIRLWLFVGMVMVAIQVMIGGITRITESGLSITEWNPILGFLPPLNENAWLQEFEKYQSTDQFKYIKSSLLLSEFKFIFFWEWFHRNWARLIGFVFLFPFLYFIISKKIKRTEIGKYSILFLLGFLQAFLGWIMVKSGLKKGMLFVDTVFLTLHFIVAIGILIYIVYLIRQKGQTVFYSVSKKFYRQTQLLILFLSIQLIYGGFMSGLKAANFASTWPTINGEWMPLKAMWKDIGYFNFIYNPFMTHFIHRTLAYIILAFICFWIYQMYRQKIKHNFSPWSFLILSVIVIQITLGVITVLVSPDYRVMRWIAVLHQLFGMSLFALVMWVFYSLKFSSTPK